MAPTRSISRGAAISHPGKVRSNNEDHFLITRMGRTFDVVSTEMALRAVAEARGVKAGALIHAVRVAVTGKTVSPGLFEVLALLGRSRLRARIAEARRRVPPPPS